MTETQRFVMESSCRQLLGLYLTCVDARNLEAMLEAFAPDVEWVRPGMPPMLGHADIRTFFQTLWQKQSKVTPRGDLTRHLLTTVSLVPLTEDRASGVSYAMVFRARGFDGKLPAPLSEPELIVEYRDEFSRRGGEWRIRRHEARHIFRSALWQPSLSEQEVAGLNLGSSPRA
jgi:ketosteroid isomerase-like protein